MNNRTVILTGAAGGIGKAIIKECVANGHKVLAIDINEKVLNELASHNPEKIITFNIDVTDYESVQKFFETMRTNFPETSVLINNAGIYLGKDITEYIPDEINKVIDVNIKSALYFSQFFAKHIAKQKTEGVIINMSSVSGQEGSSDAVYGMTKAALLGLTKSLAMNYAPDIRVNAVAPGLVETSMLRNLSEWRLEEYKSHQLRKELLQPEEVAQTVLFLLSDISKGYTGATFDLNNGCYLR